ncbi:Ig-like domain-containing domain [Winogradskyella maritima]|uniref:Ig-like domain-containing domain n=1 Tax=Winogradskyella maritima TaxID=1517766 RepID=A0ABV8AGG7_9FLAO
MKTIMRGPAFRFFCVLSLTLLIVACASRGRPSGGEKDTEPPVIVRSDPENFTTNFNKDEIRIYFNEYIKLKDIRKQLIVSPPMDNDPIISPQGSAGKYISIKITDTLAPNTTYAFNFGQSIVDNNEENPFSYYRYVFSTGPTIDSLSVTGAVLDALERQPETFITVGLYEVDSTFNDSTIYKQKPKYITNTLDSLTTFSIENIKAGTYKLVALKDNNGNYTFEPKTDKIGFVEGYIEVPKDTNYLIKLFKEVPKLKVLRPFQAGEQRVGFPFEGNPEGLKISMLDALPEGTKTRITKDRDKDSLYYWYHPKLELDSTFFKLERGTFVDTLKHKFRPAEKDSLTITMLTPGNLPYQKNMTLAGSTPFDLLDRSKITLIDKDSVAVAFTIEEDSLLNTYQFPIELKEDERYAMSILPGAFEDILGTQNDTLNFNFRTRKKSELGNIRVSLINAKLPLIVQLTDEQGKVLYEKYAETSPVVDFTNIEPKQYQLRVIFDENKNGKYDPGSFLLNTQPERTSYHPVLEDTNVRANFDYNISLTLEN